MGGTIDTYFDAWNATDDVERRALIERCLAPDVELIDENGRFSGYEALGVLMAKFHEAVPGGRIVKTSGFDEFEGITRYSWDAVDAEGNTRSCGLDVVEADAAGRLRRIVMFHGPLPPVG
ncbi:MAG TPA: nuclear transport factor 2 family protein [Solirubrobacteraceae bacterium]|nr:nuclear transport factor 2 family protein [Solirubrobacteraceae bacterium]